MLSERGKIFQTIDISTTAAEHHNLRPTKIDITDEVSQLEKRLLESEKERNKWRNYMPDGEELAECKKQACYKGEFKDSLAANHVYIVALEVRLRLKEE